MEMVGSLFTVLLLAGAGCGLRWTERLRGETGSIEICSGHDLQLFWNFTLDPGERLKGMVWGCQPEGKEEDVLATYMDGHFVPMSSFSGRLAHLQDGGIELSCTTILESGNYSIAVSIEDPNSELTVHHKTVPVNVIDRPKTQTGEIHVVRRKEAVRDVITGAWHVQLSCGNFSDRGHPPINVMWMTPTGVHLDSTDYQDGFFQLLVPNPPQEGNYSCGIAPSQAAARCLDRDSPLLYTESVEVQEVETRFLLLEARQQEFVDSLKAERDVWMSAVGQVGNRTEMLEQWRDDALQTSAPVSFHARLTTDTALSSGAVLKLPKVINNQGEGYNPSTGYFTAPMNGNYFFIATTGSYTSNKIANVRMMKGRTEVASIRLHMHDSYYSMGSCHAVLYLNAGEWVSLQSPVAWSMNYYSGSVTSFSGFHMG